MSADAALPSGSSGSCGSGAAFSTLCSPASCAPVLLRPVLRHAGSRRWRRRARAARCGEALDRGPMRWRSASPRRCTSTAARRRRCPVRRSRPSQPPRQQRSQLRLLHLSRLLSSTSRTSTRSRSPRPPRRSPRCDRAWRSRRRSPSWRLRTLPRLSPLLPLSSRRPRAERRAVVLPPVTHMQATPMHRRVLLQSFEARSVPGSGSDTSRELARTARAAACTPVALLRFPCRRHFSFAEPQRSRSGRAAGRGRWPQHALRCG